MKNLKVENLKNLKKVIEELNQPTYDEDLGKIESLFHFVIKERTDLSGHSEIVVYDENECYNIDYEEELNALSYEAAKEFGFEFVPQKDTILPKLEEAIRKDLKNPDAYLEHYDSVIMTICF